MVRYVSDEDFHGTSRVLAELANVGRLNLIVAAICRLDPSATHGRITPNQVAFALGEAGNVWPASFVLQD